MFQNIFAFRSRCNQMHIALKHTLSPPIRPSVHPPIRQTRIVYNKRYKTQIHTLQSMALHFRNKINSKWSNERGQQTNTKSQMALTTSCSHITGKKMLYRTTIIRWCWYIGRTLPLLLFYFILFFQVSFFFHSQLIRAHRIGAQKRFLVE